ncbi:MAG: S-layer homology domain-containing protein [Treponema sp.]|nr:S-layer homology domain-containing protein [Treponema sp.]
MKFFKNLTYTLLTALCIISCSEVNYAHASDGIAISRENFPDPNFRAVLSGPTYDKDRNGSLSAYEISRIYNLHCENRNIKTLKGIEYFHELRGLWCLNNHISDWDLSGNPNITGIWCSHNDFTSLDFSDCPKLEWVYCFNCKLRSLNVRNNPELAYMECNANPNLTTLDISQNPKLENLFCSDCGLTSLDVSHNPLLCELDAFKNDLKSLNFSNNLNLKRLDVWDNKDLGDVDISMLKGLQFYNCAKNNVTKLDMSNNPELVMLICSYNENLTSLNISKNPKLAFLNLECDYRLPSLDISKNPKLYHLYAFGVLGVSEIDISYNSRLLKAYNKGTKKNETHLGRVHSYTLNYGGSGDYFDDLKHEFVIDDSVKITINPVNSDSVDDCYFTKNDGHSSSENFATRAEAIQILYEKAGRPALKPDSPVNNGPDFTDIAGSPYETAIKWGKQNNICFGYPDICSDNFSPDTPINREDFALMAHRFAGYLKLGTAFDYGRTDWYDDYYDIDFYGWGPFTWAMQFEVLKPFDNNCYPHGRMTTEELKAGAEKIFNLDEAASYSSIVNGNGV